MNTNKIVFSCLYILLFAVNLQAADTDFWRKNNNNNPATIQHQEWDNFLKEYIITNHSSKINLLDYKKISGKSKLDDYVEYLTTIKITNYSMAEQKTFWINLYNALTVKIILDHYPVKSIKNIKLSGIFKSGPWKKEVISIEGQKLSLDNIEHDILRPIWKDNRIHYAVNCASIGCPNLQDTAYTVSNTEALLEKGAKAYVNHPRGANFKKDGLVVSSIYKWFQEDFEDSEKGVLKHLKKYADADLKSKLEDYQGDLDYDYDWSLNQP